MPSLSERLAAATIALMLSLRPGAAEVFFVGTYMSERRIEVKALFGGSQPRGVCLQIQVGQ